MITATQQIQKMTGGAQSHLMLGSDGFAYVVKFQNNPQHLRVLANELLATRLSQLVGLTVPQTEIVEVSQSLISSTDGLTMHSQRSTEVCKAGLQFGSRLVGGLMPGNRMDYLPQPQLDEVTNRHEFAGMLLMDKWMSNSDGRQAVFHKGVHEKRYKATFIDQGYCFDAGSWTFVDAPLRGVFARNSVYHHVRGWNDFEPWLSRLKKLDPQAAWDIAKMIPSEWYGSPISELEKLIERLFARRNRVYELILDFRESARVPFPQWKGTFGQCNLPMLPGHALQLLH